jgi:hypothetical protein
MYSVCRVGDSGASEFAVGQRVRIHPDSSDERSGVIIEDFGEDVGYTAGIGNQHIADAGRRWAVTTDDGDLVFADTPDLAAEQ